MAIDFGRYVSITSAVGGASAASARELILRLVTTNPLLPTGTVVEFETLDEVAAYFDLTTSDEYLQAAFYFGFVNPGDADLPEPDICVDVSGFPPFTTKRMLPVAPCVP